MLFKRISLPASALTALIIGLSLAACTTTPITPPAPQTAQPSPQPGTPAAPSAPPGANLRATTFAALPGWGSDDLRQALPAFLTSCSTLARKSDWKEPCAVAAGLDGNNGDAIRLFFQSFFTPYQVINADGTDNGLVTGYYEPLLKGARKRGGPYQTPIYRAPDDLITVDLASVYPELKGLRLRGRLVGNKVLPYPSRAELDKSGVLAGKEILWVDDPIDAFFLQVQGSGRVQLNDGGSVVRVAYADQNGYPYKSIGRYLVDKGELTLAQASAQGIKAWLAANPGRQQELLNANPSYVFFKEEKVLDPNVGPKGAQGVPLTPLRSIAVDPQFVLLGTPVFLATTQPNNNALLQQLMVAQDTGGAIKGAVRADFFWGFGNEAGDKAGKMKQRGMMWLLLPKLAAAR
ncbi:membrane-bound lytic murein transglycosylase A [Collimonas sp. OK607]|uniref:murein transglycosylase A n=1 Tax=Collimonas sp. OK607 TaxID=1798194 RepID=UPI0008F1615F|nr:murein transglycosylase A [Collimonas sp. OK607]SFB26477.1 membrane-bound lytic murein transglycosylase A [Collimonas sp. OK607]